MTATRPGAAEIVAPEAGRIDAPATRATEGRAITVEARGLVKRFRRPRGWRELVRGAPVQWTTPVRGIDLEAHEGELLGVLGPNGAGKTTLFRMLAGLVLPDEGSATVGGHDLVHEADAVRATVGVAFADERSLHWRLSARENLRVWAGLNAIVGAERDARITEALARVELDRTGPAMVSTFSSGMRQRLLIARALLTRPRVLLLDEPTRSLDPLSARALRRFVRDELVDRDRTTVLLATHNGEEALGLCDRVLVLDRGERLALCAPAELGAARGVEPWVVVTRADAAERVRALTNGTIREVEPDGWVRVGFDVHEGNEGAAAVVEALARAGLPFARIERVPRTLADVLDRVVTERRRRAEEG